MVSTILYRFTTFADYVNLSFSQQNMKKLLDVFADENLIPSVMKEPMPDGRVAQRLRLGAASQLISVSLFSGRINIEMLSDKKEGFGTEQQLVIDTMDKYIKKIYYAFENEIQDAYRLAWGVKNVYFEIDEQERKAYRNRFLKENTFYEDCYTDEFMAQYVGARQVQINNRQEKMNILTTISRWFPDSGLGNAASVDGYGVDFDINTHQAQHKNRFSADVFRQFMNVAVELQEELRGCYFEDCK